MKTHHHCTEDEEILQEGQRSFDLRGRYLKLAVKVDDVRTNELRD